MICWVESSYSVTVQTYIKSSDDRNMYDSLSLQIRFGLIRSLEGNSLVAFTFNDHGSLLIVYLVQINSYVLKCQTTNNNKINGRIGISGYSVSLFYVYHSTWLTVVVYFVFLHLTSTAVFIRLN